jgi:hypothetical protein
VVVGSISSAADMFLKIFGSGATRQKTNFQLKNNKPAFINTLEWRCRDLSIKVLLVPPLADAVSI